MLAGDALKDTFGVLAKELNATTLAQELRRQIGPKVDELAAAQSLLASNRLPGGQMLDAAIGFSRVILKATDEDAIGTFNDTHRAIKDAIKRATEVAQSVTDPHIKDLEEAARIVRQVWPELRGEADWTPALEERAVVLADRIDRETFFRDLHDIEIDTQFIANHYRERHRTALAQRDAAFEAARIQLRATAGFDRLTPGQLDALLRPLTPLPAPGSTLAHLRSETEAASPRLRFAIAELRRILEGERLIAVDLAPYFGAGLETEAELDQALKDIRERCAALILAGKKVVLA